jgi:RNA polymerase sigma-70 factor (ECF subfamily)
VQSIRAYKNPQDVNDAGEKLEANELQRKISGLMHKMPVVQKKVFEMSRFEGMSYRDIAATLSISVKTVETHISRALNYLRQHLNLLVLLILSNT